MLGPPPPPGPPVDAGAKLPGRSGEGAHVEYIWAPVPVCVCVLGIKTQSQGIPSGPLVQFYVVLRGINWTQ